MLEKASSGDWQKAATNQCPSGPEAFASGEAYGKGKGKRLMSLNVDRDETVAFAVYTQHRRVLKLDGLGNKITMLAYANPEDRTDEKKRADGWGIARYDKANREITFECWDRWSDVTTEGGQFPGWPITLKMAENDGRQKTHWLPELKFTEADPVVQVVSEADDEILYTVRVKGDTFQPAVYAAGKYTVKTGRDKPDGSTNEGVEAASDNAAAGSLEIE